MKNTPYVSELAPLRTAYSFLYRALRKCYKYITVRVPNLKPVRDTKMKVVRVTKLNPVRVTHPLQPV